ncbi:MAG: dipeptide ABC transporter ATP-binding protein [Lentisphaeria bacterium]|nr:dipeptide ABC transporter ATP-binding protein [Lentisphaeria bacterium]
MSLLRVEHLKKYYRAPSPLFGPKRLVRALDDVSFELDEGETLGLVGESGCGKSTLARQLIRLEDPTAGKIFLDGVELGALHGGRLRKIRGNFQMIFQDPYASLNPRMSVYSTLEEALKLHTELDENGRADRIAELLRQVGLKPEHARRYPHQFSGGQRQRIGIARALAVRPRFIVADEPVSALDVSVQSQIVNLLQDIQKETGVAFLFIAHDLAVVEHISHRIMVMYLGRLTETGPAHELCAHPAHPYTRALLSSVPTTRPEKMHERIILTGDVPSPLNPPTGCRFHPRCPCRQAICEKEEPCLQSIDSAGKHLCACHFPMKSGEKTEKI